MKQATLKIMVAPGWNDHGYNDQGYNELTTVKNKLKPIHQLLKPNNCGKFNKSSLL
jgi:hypothetical protein